MPFCNGASSLNLGRRKWRPVLMTSRTAFARAALLSTAGCGWMSASKGSPMFNKPVVFVIGAGASCEYGLPLGAALKASIAKKIQFGFQHGFQLSSGDAKLLDHIRRHTKNDHVLNNQYTVAANELSKAIEAFISIDEAMHFVASSTKAVEVGKIAIVSEILAAEGKSALATSRDTGSATLNEQNGGWLAHMLSMALAGTQKADLEKLFEKVTFVNFNYDRCLEHYLYEALQQKTAASSAQAGEIVDGLNVIRPYGSLGTLEWQVPRGVAFGYTGHVDPFLLIDKIRTYTEQDALHDATKIDRALRDAELVVILGFGFHKQNLEILALPNFSRTNAAEVLATVVGIHKENLGSISQQICDGLKINKHDVGLQDMKTTELLQQLRPRIMNRLS
jgi:hypothetical protein